MGEPLPGIRDLPKAELHLHIEGTLEPDLVFALAERNDVPLPWGSVHELRERYAFGSLPDFLDLYYQCMAVLRTPDDFFELAMAYFDRAIADGVRHAEVFFDPQVHLSNGNTLPGILDGLGAAFTEARNRYQLTGGLIMCFLRDWGPEAAAELLNLAEPYAEALLGVGMDSAEVGFPPEPFAEVFARARALGLHTVAHGGEEGGPEYVRGALDALGAERIDHGLRALDDPDLVRRMVSEGIGVTGCPLSNVRLQVIPDVVGYPLQEMLDAGLLLSINSDDPAYFGGYLADNFAALALDEPTARQLCRNSIETSFATKTRKAELQAELG
jgi:adenosine deaminase